ncbi:MAG: hypothetical protein J5787_08840 [Alphaproteobacteria bacterium]|nr:hypothetical protein [Alphaproteobacteria bacterium]
MLNMDFTVDLSVWQDGFTFQSEPVQTVKAETPRLANKPSFAQQLKETAVSEPEKTVAAQKPVAAPVPLTAQEQKVQEIPAALADVVDLTPFVVSADTVSKPGTRLNEQLERTTFSKKTGALIGKESPYNMSEEKAKAREARQTAKILKAPENAKVFPMNTAARYRNNETKFGENLPLAASASEQAKQLRIEEMKQQAKIKAVNETNTSLAKKPVIDPEAIRSQVSSEGFGYKRPNLPNTSSETVSAAASWFPEAMTRQLDAYEAAKKVAQYGATQKSVTDLAI